MYISSDLKGTRWYLLGGTSMPLVHMTTIQLEPGNPNRLFAATYGKGVMFYDFPQGAQLPVTASLSSAQGSVAGTTSSAPALPNTAPAHPSQGGALAVAGLLGCTAWIRRRARRTRASGRSLG